MKKYILGLIIALTAPVIFAYAATPVLTVSGNGDNNNVTVQVTGGDPNAQVVLFYNQVLGSTVQQANLGYTDNTGSWRGVVSTSALGITQSSPVYVQVNWVQSSPVNWPYSAAGATSTNTIIFAPANPSFMIGQNGVITLSGGGGGTYYVTANSNPNLASAGITGNTLTVSGEQPGQASFTVCSSSGACAVVTPTFTTSGSSSGGSTSSGGAPALSQSSLSIGQGGQGTVTLSGGTSPYSVSVIGGSGVSTTLAGNTLYVNGETAGTATLNICSAATSTATGVTSSLCTPVTVNVSASGTTASSTGSTGGTTSGGSNLSFSLPISAGEAVRLAVNGGTGSYYIQPMSGSSVSAALNGNTLTLTGLSSGSGTVTVCSNGISTTAPTCMPIMVSVGPALTGTGGGYFFESDLQQGASGEDVTELQQRLKDLGYFNATVTGYFGPLTASAVKAYQSANGISATGYVGPLTRAAFNK